MCFFVKTAHGSAVAFNCRLLFSINCTRDGFWEQ